MVGVAQRNHVVVAGVSARHEEGEIVRFRAGVDEIADLEFTRHLCGQLLGVLRHVRVQINRGGMLQQFVLFPGRLHHIGVTMADANRDDATKRIEVTPPGFVPDVLHLSFHEHERLFVIEKNSRIQKLFAQAQDFVRGRAGVGLRLMMERRQLRCLHREDYSLGANRRPSR